MRFGMVPETVALDERLGRMSLRVMILLCTRMDGKTRRVTAERCSTRSLARALGVHAKGVQRAKRQLIERGHVRRTGDEIHVPKRGTKSVHPLDGNDST